MLGRVVDRVLAGEPPHTDRREHLEVRCERAHRHLEAHLVVPLARATVGDGVGTVLAGRADEVARDDRARQRGDEWVLALVERVGLERGRDVVAGELVLRVDDDRLDRARGERAATDRLPVVVSRLADVDRERDDLGPPLLRDPA